jgi:hypothetical protein
MWKEGVVAHLTLLAHRVSNQTEENAKNQIGRFHPFIGHKDP